MKSKINLLVITSQWPEEENDIAGVFIVDYIKSIKSRCNVILMVLRLVGNKQESTIEGNNGIIVIKGINDWGRMKGGVKYFIYLKWLYKAWRVGINIPKIDLVHAHGAPINGNIGRIIAKKKNASLLITEHTGPFNKILKNPIVRCMTKSAMNAADGVLVVSDNLKAQIDKSGINPKKIWVTWNPVDVELFCPENRSKRLEPKRMIFVGRLEEYKGGLRVVEAFSKILAEFPEWSLTIIGEGPERQPIEEFIRKSSGLSGKVMLKGQLAKSDVAEEMANASFLVFPSRHETFGLVVAEAMAAGLPVIVGKGTAMDEFVDDSCGILIDPDDAGKIASAMKSMILNYHQFDRMKIRQKVVDRFGIDAFGRRLIDIYRSVI